MCPARELNPGSSAFRADALTTELRGWDNSTRRNIFTQLVPLRQPRTSAMGGQPLVSKWFYLIHQYQNTGIKGRQNQLRNHYLIEPFVGLDPIDPGLVIGCNQEEF